MWILCTASLSFVSMALGKNHSASTTMDFLFFSLKIICRDEILFASQYTPRVKNFQSPDDTMNYRVITVAPPGDGSFFQEVSRTTDLWSCRPVLYPLGWSQNLILQPIPILILQLKPNQMNTSEKEMLKMLSLFTFSYLQKCQWSLLSSCWDQRTVWLLVSTVKRASWPFAHRLKTAKCKGHCWKHD